jgi:hypothetical protein
MQRGVLRIRRGQWIAGGLVFLLTILCGILSARWSERAFSRPAASAGDSGKGAGNVHTRTCVTLGGKRFEWNFPNPPFGTLSCSE